MFLKAGHIIHKKSTSPGTDLEWGIIDVTSIAMMDMLGHCPLCP
jgi:hypothetical protein